MTVTFVANSPLCTPTKRIAVSVVTNPTVLLKRVWTCLYADRPFPRAVHLAVLTRDKKLVYLTSLFELLAIATNWTSTTVMVELNVVVKSAVMSGGAEMEPWADGLGGNLWAQAQAGPLFCLAQSTPKRAKNSPETIVSSDQRSALLAYFGLPPNPNEAVNVLKASALPTNRTWRYVILAQRLFCDILLLCIYSVQSFPQFRDETDKGNRSTSSTSVNDLFVLETVCIALLTLEYLAKLITSPYFFALGVDFMAILPYYLIVALWSVLPMSLLDVFRAARFVVAMRLLRYSPGLINQLQSIYQARGQVRLLTRAVSFDT